MVLTVVSWILRLHLAVLIAFVFAPIAMSVVVSFNTDQYLSAQLTAFTTQWYQLVWEDEDFWAAAQRSLIVAFCSATLATIIGFATAYTDHRYRFFGRPVLVALALAPATVPLLIFGVATLGWLSQVNLSGSLLSIIIAHTTLTIPFAMGLIRLRLSQMSDTLEPAAHNLGASDWQAMAAVVLPFCLPSIAAAFFLCAAVSFDELVVAWMVGGTSDTIPTFIRAILEGNTDPRINAIGTFVFLTSIALVVMAQLLMMAGRRRKVSP